MAEVPSVLPEDEYNAKLLANAHPPNWKNPEPAKRYNIVVIGAGTAGLVTAAGAAGLGAKVALIEKHLMGGDCLNVGCVPSKCLIRSAKLYADIRDAADYGINVPKGVKVDFPAVMQRMRRLRASIAPHDSVERFSGLGIDIFLGTGRFSGPDTVEVDGKTLRFARAAITTGGRAVRPPIEGLDEVGYLTNETVFSLTERPKRMAVLGAGPLGCELAQTFHRLGCEVTLIQRSSQILTREDRDAARIVEESLLKDGIVLKLNTVVIRAEKTEDGKLLHLKTDGAEDKITVDRILVGAGRTPNVEDLDLERAGVVYDKRLGVIVDDNLRTSNKNIYAAGDICMKYKFTHTADAAARILIKNALFWGRSKLSALTVPWCTYTDPEIAHVGMYERDADEQGIPYDVYTRLFNEVDRAIADGEENGLVKVIVRKGTDKILGGTIVARHAGEMISELSVAIVGGVGLGSISGTIHPYPTQAEAIKQVGDAYNRTRLTPFAKKLFTRIMKWRR